jgi:hypothetical protein
MGIIKKMFVQLNTLPNHITILGGGNLQGADQAIKKITLEIGFDYKEYNPVHTDFNEYSALPKYRYGKTYKPLHFATRYNDLVKDCDKLIVFYNTKIQDKFLENAIKQARKLDKKLVIMS